MRATRLFARALRVMFVCVVAWGAAYAGIALAQAEPARNFSQRLLDQALAALTPREPDKINLYLLAVAGDGSQEVFRREVEFVRTQFAERFGVKGRAITLVNSRNTVGAQPTATRDNLRDALRGIAARMDTQQDILFLFMTSHGSTDHRFLLAEPKGRPRGLQARALGELLRESGIRWKVIVVSACYSGGFIEHLKDDTTLIITAARHDRSSFGCSDENEFTYFGRAFFKEALPRAQSFEDAFAKAGALVREWEEEDYASAPAGAKRKTMGTYYSHPQLHGTSAITQHLQQWWAQPVK